MWSSGRRHSPSMPALKFARNFFPNLTGIQICTTRWNLCKKSAASFRLCTSKMLVGLISSAWKDHQWEVNSCVQLPILLWKELDFTSKRISRHSGLQKSKFTVGSDYLLRPRFFYDLRPYGSKLGFFIFLIWNIFTLKKKG